MFWCAVCSKKRMKKNIDNPVLLPPFHKIELLSLHRHSKIESPPTWGSRRWDTGHREAAPMTFSGASRALHLAVKRSCQLNHGPRARMLETRWLVEGSSCLRTGLNGCAAFCCQSILVAAIHGSILSTTRTILDGDELPIAHEELFLR